MRHSKLADRVALTEFARTHGLPRIAWALGNDEPEPVAVLRRPRHRSPASPSRRHPAPSCRLRQRARPAIIAAVLDALPANGRIAELFAGCGTITFAMAERIRVAAWEGDAASASALRIAANHAGLAGRIEVTQRDLARQPLQAKELAGFAGGGIGSALRRRRTSGRTDRCGENTSGHLRELQSRHAGA